MFVRSPDRLARVSAGFPLGAESRARVERIVRAFLHGYNVVASCDHPLDARAALDRTDPFHRPFAYEGACMGYGAWAVTALRGFGSFEPLMVRRLVPETVYQDYVGLGWWLGMWYSRRPAALARVSGRLDFRYRLLVYEGLGFRSGFHRAADPRRVVAGFARHGAEARHVCHQGFGRSLWFVHMDEPSAANRTIERLPPAYRGDCYSGLGLGCAFSRLDRADLIAETAAGVPEPYRPDFLQGAAFGWEARQLADPGLFAALTAGAPAAVRRHVQDSIDAVHAVRDGLLADGLRADFYQAWRAGTRRRLAAPPRAAATEPRAAQNP